MRTLIEMKNYSSRDVLRILRRRQGKRTQKELAREIGISPAYLSDVLAERRNVSERILKYVGLVMTFVPKGRIED